MNFDKLILKRASVRKFLDDMPDDHQITTILDAGRVAPSACNKQPWRFTVIQSAENLAKIRKAYSREWFETAPVVIAISVNRNESWHRQSDNKDHGDIDAAIAIDHMTLMAAEIGLGSCWICNFDVNMANSIVGVGENEDVIALLPIGYEDKSGKTNPRTRRPLMEIVKYI